MVLLYRALELAVTHDPVRYADIVAGGRPRAVPPCRRAHTRIRRASIDRRRDAPGGLGPVKWRLPMSVVTALGNDLGGNLGLTAHRVASMVTMQPLNSSNSSSFGFAVISLDFSAVACCPSTSRLQQPQALTMCSADVPRRRSREPHAVLPSTATTSPPLASATASVQLTKHAWSAFGCRREST